MSSLSRVEVDVKIFEIRESSSKAWFLKFASKILELIFLKNLNR